MFGDQGAISGAKAFYLCLSHLSVASVLKELHGAAHGIIHSCCVVLPGLIMQGKHMTLDIVLL